ncbi:unnamed protein product [Pieris brassicae]|uniref:TIL domain-containing protein n=1 Tax=Pieris brassicae TaxID=7116 RepID=A0A9P0TAN9_PIEBR|nr:unnamed protein product [Pieris brassicae]
MSPRIVSPVFDRFSKGIMTLKVLPILLLFYVAYSMEVGEKSSIIDCPENEVYVNCTLGVCWRTCEDLKKRPPCPPLAPFCVLPGCLCNDDWKRNTDGVCVPPQDCCKL